MKQVITREHIHLGSEYGINRGKTVQVLKGINHFVITPIGQIEHRNSDNRPYCKGEKFRDSKQEVHPSAIVHASYKITLR